MFFLHQSTFLAHNHVPHKVRHKEFFEREIEGTKIIHVFFEPSVFDSNSISNVIKIYILQNINPNFRGVVSSTPSYNSDKNGSIAWRIPDIKHNIPLKAVYFDGGSRPGIDQQYDLIDLRWLGRGSPHMYCFWNIKYLHVLEHNDVIKNNDVKNAHDGFEMIDEHTPLINKCPHRLMIKTFFKIMAEQVTNKVHKTIPLGDFFIAEILGKNSKKLVDAVADILNKNPDDLEAAIKVISSVEDKLMGLLDRF